MQSGIITICGFLSVVMLRRSRGNIICPDTIRACQSLPAHNNNVKQSSNNNAQSNGTI